MFRFDRLVLTVMLVGVAVVAWGAVKIPSFVVEEFYLACDNSTPIDVNLDPNADGMAILNYVSAQEKTVVQVIVSDFTGTDTLLNGRYFVRLSPGDGLDIGTFLVDSQGNGNFHGEVSGDHSDKTVELWAQPGACIDKHLIASGQ